MAVSTLEDAPHRANAEMALHVLEIMEAVHVASESGRHVELATRCERPQPLPEGRLRGRQTCGIIRVAFLSVAPSRVACSDRQSYF